MTDLQVIEHLDILEFKLDRLTFLVEGKTPKFLTVQETANLLRCSTSSIRDKMRHGKLPFQRLGDSESSPILILRSNVMEMLK